MLWFLAGLVAAQRFYQPLPQPVYLEQSSLQGAPAPLRFRTGEAYQLGDEPARTAVPQWTGLASVAVVCGVVGALVRPRATRGADARSKLRTAMLAVGGLDRVNLLQKEDLKGAFT